MKAKRLQLLAVSLFIPLLLGLVLKTAVFTPTTHAADAVTTALITNLTVNTVVDALDSGDGFCSLREAITAANTDTASGIPAGECPAGNGADTIHLPAGIYTLTLTGANEDANVSGDLDITADLTINGISNTLTLIDGNTSDRVFHIFSGVDVILNKLTVQNGHAPNGARGGASGDGARGGDGGGSYKPLVLVHRLN